MLKFTASAEIKGGENAARQTLDAFREAVRPSSEFGVILWNLRPAAACDTYTLDVEIDEDDPALAERIFDGFREAVIPSDHGISLYGLQPADDPDSTPGFG